MHRSVNERHLCSEVLREGRYLLFNDEFNTFVYSYISVSYMIKDQLSNEIRNLLPLCGLLFLLRQQMLFDVLYHIDRIIHNTVFGIPVMGY